MKKEYIYLILAAILIILKFSHITSVDWPFIIIFIIFTFLSLPEISLKNLNININHLFESDNELKHQIWALQDKIKVMEEKLLDK